jgi:glycerate kinase
MALSILIIPDKFKGTLTAQAAAQAVAKGWRKVRSQDHLELLPMSDGGDGFGEVMSKALKARVQNIKTIDAAHRACSAQWWWDAKTKTAVIEAARINGLAQLPHGRFHPFDLDSFGIGAVIRAASAKGARRCLVGIGGSATNDGGFGLARSLGWEFLDREGNQITNWTQLHSLVTISPPKRTHWFEELVVAVDVQNLLLGKKGCSRIYGPQKGLAEVDFPLAERSLRRLAAVVKKQFNRDFANEPGAGAAGGLGFGFHAFLQASMEPGFDLFARHANLTRHLRSADLVITGEGAIDQSTLMGKGVGQIAERCRKLKIPCLGLAGHVAIPKNATGYFTHAYGLTQITSLPNAKARPAFWLEQLAKQAARNWPK